MSDSMYFLAGVLTTMILFLCGACVDYLEEKRRQLSDERKNRKSLDKD